VRGLGGGLYLLGSLFMVYNVWRTIRGDVRDEAPLDTPAPTRPDLLGSYPGDHPAPAPAPVPAAAPQPRPAAA
jgi:cytochrome c oxidase cbb3-type subunit 1